jgi:hypothetical protein
MRLTAEDLQRRFAELHALVNEWDPVHLLADGAPNSEYAGYVGPILHRLEAGVTADALARDLDSEYRIQFDAEPHDVRAFATRAVDWFATRWANSDSAPLGDTR